MALERFYPCRTNTVTLSSFFALQRDTVGRTQTKEMNIFRFCCPAQENMVYY